MIRAYCLYLLRWQLSTPILALCIIFFTPYFNNLVTTVIANFIGGLLFFWVDDKIFKSVAKESTNDQ